MRRNLALSFFLCVVLCVGATSGFAQSRLNGKWATDRPANPPEVSFGQRGQSVQLEVSIEDAKASGTLSIGGLGGTFYIFKDGKVAGNKVQFQEGLQDIEPTWTIEMVDDNTVMLYRGGLPLVGKNVLDLISAIGGLSQPASPVQAVSAQGGANGTLSGVVQDPTRARIPGVPVTATNVDTGVTLSTTTDDAGRYGFPNAIPGTYTLTASLQGFKTTTVRGVRIGAAPVQLDLILELAVRSSANPSVDSCDRSLVVWCTLLHRAK